ncbi:MAG: hypothetical protein ACTHKS_08340 [Gaiellaceae bacterium]
MQRLRLTTLLTAVAVASLLGAGFADGTVYSGSATRAAAQADRRAHISAPARDDVPMGKPTMRFAFRLTRNSGEVAAYRTHAAAVNALAQGEVLAKAFGQSLQGLATVYDNVIIGFDKRPTSSQRAETRSWLRVR